MAIVKWNRWNPMYPSILDEDFWSSNLSNMLDGENRTGIDIYALRIGNIIEPNEYHRFKEFCENPRVRLRNLFNYIDARDLAQAIELCIQKDGLGYEVFNVTHNNNSVKITTEEIIKEFFPNVKLKRTLDKNESILSSQKIRKILGFKPEHDWRKYYQDN